MQMNMNFTAKSGGNRFPVREVAGTDATGDRMASATGRELAATTGTSAGGSGAGTTGVILIAVAGFTDLRNLPAPATPHEQQVRGAGS